MAQQEKKTYEFSDLMEENKPIINLFVRLKQRCENVIGESESQSCLCDYRLNYLLITQHILRAEVV